MCNLSLKENPICDNADYREKVFGIFEDLEVLDNMDKDGEEMPSDEDDIYGDDDEDGEIDEETRKRLLEQGYDLGDDDEDGEYDDLGDDDEEGEDFGDYDDEDEDEEESEDKPANKRQKK